MTIGVAVIGAGHHSRGNHGPALARCREEGADVELRAVCDLEESRAEAYADSFGFERAYTDVDAMLDAEEPDAVVEVTPVEASRDLVGDLLTRDLAVLLEKPPGESPGETVELRDIAREHGADHMVSLNRRFNPAVSRAREWLAGRPAPDLVAARLARVDRLEPWFVTGTGIHAVDTALSVLPAPERVTCRRWQSRDEGGESAAARIDCGDAAAEVVLAPDAGTAAETYTIFGPGYTVAADVRAASLAAHAGGEPAVTWRHPTDAPGYERNGTLAETRAFLDAVRGEGEFAPTLADAVPTMRAVHAADAGGERDLA